MGDVKDIANYSKEVKSARMFDLLGGQVSFIRHSTAFLAQVSTKHWHRVDLKSYSDDPSIDREMAFFMRQTMRAAHYQERSIEALQAKVADIGRKFSEDADLEQPSRAAAERSGQSSSSARGAHFRENSTCSRAISQSGVEGLEDGTLATL